MLLQTGDKDFWSDPKGEFLAAVAAGPVYRLLGKQGLDTNEMPSAGVGIFHDIGYFMHSGGHGTIPSDWDQYLKFIQMHLEPVSAQMGDWLGISPLLRKLRASYLICPILFEINDALH